MLSVGVWEAVSDTLAHPGRKLPELGLSAATGSVLGAVERLGTPGKVVAAGIGSAMLLKLGYDEITGERWSRFGAALKDTWKSGQNMDRNIAITRDSLGSFLVDTGIGYAGMRAGSALTARLAPRGKLVDSAIARSNKDGGTAMRNLQDRYENPLLMKKQAGEDITLITHTEPASPGQARGDLIRVQRNTEGDIVLAAMDVEGHGPGAAKKALKVHQIMDDVLPGSRDKSASDILALVDDRIPQADDLSLTAGMMLYKPKTGELQTATASSQLAYVIRKTGEVRQLDAEVGGLPLGNGLYSGLPRGNETLGLVSGDTVIVASDGVFDRFGYGAASKFQKFLEGIGPHPERIRDGILNAPPPVNGADDASFIIFQKP
ncbi:MAG: PP2C family protein-serine/threonine phosphatase [Candidatus Obscuribacterales bacterium]